jgi:hypothetical protein
MLIALTNTVYDVIDTGVHYLVNMYDSWKVEDILDQDSDVYRIRHHPSLLCIKNILNRSNCVYPESSYLRHY